MSKELTAGARAILREIGQGGRCFTRTDTLVASAYLERHGRITPVDAQDLHRLISAGFLRAKQSSSREQPCVLTAKGRGAYRRLTRPRWHRWLPWTPLQRLQLALLPLCLLCGMAAEVALGELGIRSEQWVRIGSTAVMLMPLVLAYAWHRWHGA